MILLGFLSVIFLVAQQRLRHGPIARLPAGRLERVQRRPDDGDRDQRDKNDREERRPTRLCVCEESHAVLRGRRYPQPHRRVLAEREGSQGDPAAASVVARQLIRHRRRRVHDGDDRAILPAVRRRRRVGTGSRAEARAEWTKHRLRLGDRPLGAVRDGARGYAAIRVRSRQLLHVRLATRGWKAQPELGDRDIPPVDVPREREVTGALRVDAGGVVPRVVREGRPRRVGHPC